MMNLPRASDGFFSKFSVKRYSLGSESTQKRDLKRGGSVVYTSRLRSSELTRVLIKFT